jgi:hypothetical protein
MRATEIIRNILDIIDDLETQAEPAGPTADVTVTAQGDDINRFKQIVSLADNDPTGYANEPDERIAGIAAVTTDAGGGMNGPKHPADIKGSTMSLYPGTVYGAK